MSKTKAVTQEEISIAGDIQSEECDEFSTKINTLLDTNGLTGTTDRNFLANDNELLTGECNNTISRELEEEKLRKIETEVKEKERIISNKDEEIDKYKETTTNLENRIRESEVDVNG
ncbi:hypothetical protein RhiirA1_476751 [Rhizophagus irregularis]|uniref:Uncharacterized protein n=1 Tax=Rhizophagus irregularis TaxID=588596 RepID=A0A2N0QUM3_9GLOM|nr:hypothetical protein RhiirA1_476751 [Rhizophagus irregularis]